MQVTRECFVQQKRKKDALLYISLQNWWCKEIAETLPIQKIEKIFRKYMQTLVRNPS